MTVVQSVSDDYPISINDVVIEQAPSYEPDDDGGDGGTIAAIAIGADCQSFNCARSAPGQ